MSVKMTVKKRIPGMPVCFISFFVLLIAMKMDLKNNMTPYEPRHEKTCLGTDHLIFWVGGGGAVFFSSRFSSDRKTEIFFLTVREPKYVFQDKAKTFFFSKQHICSKCILLDLYVRVFLGPNIHGYIVYMFVYTYILDI